MIVYRDEFKKMSLLVLEVAKESSIFPRKDTGVIGDVSNPTSMWLERYVPRIDQNKSVDDLTFLAAYTVLTGHFFNSAVVDGLDVIVCKPTGFKQFSEDEMKPLRDRELDVSNRIGELLI